MSTPYNNHFDCHDDEQFIFDFNLDGFSNVWIVFDMIPQLSFTNQPYFQPETKRIDLFKCAVGMDPVVDLPSAIFVSVLYTQHDFDFEKDSLKWYLYMDGILYHYQFGPVTIPDELIEPLDAMGDLITLRKEP